MGARRPRAVVLDAGAFIAFERNDRKVRALVELALSSGAALHTPAGVIAQVWRDGRRQARLARLIGSGVVAVQPLDLDEGQAVGVLCHETRSTDIVDVSVALLGRRHRAIVVTSDEKDLNRIDAALETIKC
jgi:predicted nucleic acid-binding protein